MTSSGKHRNGTIEKYLPLSGTEQRSLLMLSSEEVRELAIILR